MEVPVGADDLVGAADHDETVGADGAEGLLTLKNTGARTIAQDKETSVVWGMPGEAVKRGAALETLPLSAIAQRIKEWVAR